MRRAAVWIAAAAALYCLAAADVAWRARGAFLEGEKYLRWHRQPELKRAYFDARLSERESALKAERAAGRMDDVELRQRLALARAERDNALAESSLKYAVRWYQTACDLLTPPETRWTRLSRSRLAQAREDWIRELRERGVEPRDFQLQ